MDNVHAEDRIIVRNVAAAIEALKAEKVLSKWTVETGPGCYSVNAFIYVGVDWEFSKAVLESVHDVNPCRVLSVAVGSVAGKPRIKVRISDRNEPLMLTETQIVTVRKRARWAVGGR